MTRRGQRGFTLVEILVAMAIGGMLLPVLVSGIFQLVRGTVRINTDLVVLQDVDGASAWINRDLSQAETTDLPNDQQPYPTMRVDWVDETGWAVEGAESHYAEYTVATSTTDLLRDFDGVTQIVARRISSIQFSRNGTYVSVTITSALRDTSETLTYFITPRADGALQ